MRYQFTLILLLLNLTVFGLISYTFLNPKHPISLSGSLQQSIQAALAEVERIELVSGDLSKPITIEKIGLQWFLSAPEKWSANPFAINSLMNQLEFLEVTASFSLQEIKASQQSLADYGLESPQLKITIAAPHQSLSLAIGSQTARGNTIYILGPDLHNVYVVTIQSIQKILKSIESLRSQQIFSIPLFELEGLHFESLDKNNQNLKIKLARTHDQWNFTAPLAAAANKAAVQDTLNKITKLQLINFIEASELNNSPLNLKDATTHLTLVGNNRHQTLSIGPETSNKKGYYAKLASSPVIFTVQKPLIDALSAMKDSLRDRSFMRSHNSKLHAINLYYKNKKLRLQRLETGHWQTFSQTIAGENLLTTQAADTALVQSLITNIRNLRASDFITDTADAISLKKYGFNQAIRRIELIDKAQNTTTLILAYPAGNDSQLFAKLEQENSIYAVAREATLNQIPHNDFDYWPRHLQALPQAAKIVSLSLKSWDHKTSLFNFDLQEPQDNWDEIFNTLTEQKSRALQHLIATIRQPKIKDYVSNRFLEAGYESPLKDNEIQPWKFRLSARIELPNGDFVKSSFRELVLSNRLSGSIQIGGSMQEASTFRLKSDTITALYTFTDSMPIPPELNGDFVKPALPITPLTTPDPIRKP